MVFAASTLFAGTQELTQSDCMLDDVTARMVDEADKLDHQMQSRQRSTSGSVEDVDVDSEEFAAATALSLQEQDQPDNKQNLNSVFHTSPKPSPERSKEEILLSSGTGTDRSEQDNDAVQPPKTSKFFSTGPTCSHHIRQPAPAGWSLAAQQSSSAQTDAQPIRGFVNSVVQSSGKAVNFLQNTLGLLPKPFSPMAQVRKSFVMWLLLTRYHEQHS